MFNVKIEYDVYYVQLNVFINALVQCLSIIIGYDVFKSHHQNIRITLSTTWVILRFTNAHIDQQAKDVL